ncbi:MAG: type II secretion system F family protein [Candidatus Geothermarchaeales archaeon]
MIWASSLATAFSILLITFIQGLHHPESPYLIPLRLEVNNVFVSIIIIALLSPTVASYLNLRFKRSVEANTPAFLRDLADNVESGLTLPQSLREASKNDYGPITAQLKKSLAKFMLGKKFNEAVMEMGRGLHHPQALQTATVIEEAYNAGGRVGEVLLTAVDVYSTLNEYRERRRTRMSPYSLLIFMAVFIFLIVSYVILNRFFPPLYQSGSSMFLENLPSLDYFKSILLWACVLESLFGGLICGKISQGTISSGLLNSLILTGISVVFFNLMI